MRKTKRCKSGRDIIVDVSKFSLLYLSAPKAAELSGRLARLGLAGQIFVGEIHVVLMKLLWFLGNYYYENCLQKRGIPTTKLLCLSPVSKTLLKTPRFPLQFLFGCFVFPLLCQGCLHFIAVCCL